MNHSLGWIPEPEDAYDSFLGCLANAIDGLKSYEHVANPGPRLISTNSWLATPLARDVTSDEAALHHRNSDGTNGLHWEATSTSTHHSQASTSHVGEGSLEKRMRAPDLERGSQTAEVEWRSSKRIKVDHL
jgi:hypothetical protein